MHAFINQFLVQNVQNVQVNAELLWWRQGGGLGQNVPLGRTTFGGGQNSNCTDMRRKIRIIINNIEGCFDALVCSMKWGMKIFGGVNLGLSLEGKWEDDERPLREKHFFHCESDFPQRDYQDERRKLAIDFFLQNIKMKTYRIWKWIFTQLSILSFPDTQN